MYFHWNNCNVVANVNVWSSSTSLTDTGHTYLCLNLNLILYGPWVSVWFKSINSYSDTIFALSRSSSTMNLNGSKENEVALLAWKLGLPNMDKTYARKDKGVENEAVRCDKCVWVEVTKLDRFMPHRQFGRIPYNFIFSSYIVVQSK